MAQVKVLIAVKTYPSLSTKYDELVCTAGFREDGSWIRLYPLPFRKLDFESRYKKYQWIELDVERYTADPRPESYRPTNYERIAVGDVIDTDKGFWYKRREIALRNVYTSYPQLLSDAKDKKKCTSLAVFKPQQIINFIVEPAERDWDSKKIELLKAKAAQGNLFQETVEAFKLVNKLPYKFSYVFLDEESTQRTMMIEDWEIGQLYWNCLKRHKGDEVKACADVRAKYLNDLSLTKDLHFYLGTTRQFHFIAPNPFIIIGTFHPKPLPIVNHSMNSQLTLF